MTEIKTPYGVEVNKKTHKCPMCTEVCTIWNVSVPEGCVFTSGCWPDEIEYPGRGFAEP